MLARQRFAVILLAIGMSAPRAHSQEGVSPDATPPPAGVEKTYWDLSKSKDAKTRGLAERYLNLVKLQEWNDLSGKFRTVAKYVKHDANLATVTIETVKGRGAERTTKEVSVPVDKLSKTCQSRVKQIDTLQKLLKDVAAKVGTEGEAGTAAQNVGPEGQDVAPTPDSRGLGPEGGRGPDAPPAAGPEFAPPAATPAGPEAGLDPSASDPDPLGFAEIANSPGGPGPPPNFPVPPGGPPTAPTEPGNGDRSQWRTSLPAFVANLSAGTDPSGNPTVDWGELADLRALNDMIAAQPNAAATPEAAAIAQRIGEVNWQLEIERVDQGPEGDVTPTFRLPQLAMPLDIQFALDPSESPQSWANLAPGTPVNVTGRLQIQQPNRIMVTVKLAGPASAGAAGREAPPAETAAPAADARP